MPSSLFSPPRVLTQLWLSRGPKPAPPAPGSLRVRALGSHQTPPGARVDILEHHLLAFLLLTSKRHIKKDTLAPASPL